MGARGVPAEPCDCQTIWLLGDGQVVDRASDPCPKCDDTMNMERIAGRSIEPWPVVGERGA